MMKALTIALAIFFAGCAPQKDDNSENAIITCTASSHFPAYSESRTVILDDSDRKIYFDDVLDKLSQIERSLFLSPDEPSYTFIFKNSQGKELKSIVISKRIFASSSLKNLYPAMSEKELIEIKKISELMEQLFQNKLKEKWNKLFTFKEKQ